MNVKGLDSSQVKHSNVSKVEDVQTLEEDIFPGACICSESGGTGLGLW